MKQKHAVALQYKSAEELPTVLSHGYGKIAEQLIALAESHGIPITENTELTALLSETKSGQPISDKAIKLVAHIISYLYFCDKKFNESHQFLAATLNKNTV